MNLKSDEKMFTIRYYDENNVFNCKTHFDFDFFKNNIEHICQNNEFGSNSFSIDFESKNFKEMNFKLTCNFSDIKYDFKTNVKDYLISKISLIVKIYDKNKHSENLKLIKRQLKYWFNINDEKIIMNTLKRFYIHYYDSNGIHTNFNYSDYNSLVDKIQNIYMNGDYTENAFTLGFCASYEDEMNLEIYPNFTDIESESDGFTDVDSFNQALIQYICNIITNYDEEECYKESKKLKEKLKYWFDYDYYEPEEKKENIEQSTEIVNTFEIKDYNYPEIYKNWVIKNVVNGKYQVIMSYEKWYEIVKDLI